MKKKANSKGTVLVTGGAKRIGRAICLELASSGYNIALHFNQSKSQAKKTHDAIVQKGVSCKMFQCNLANSDETMSLIAKVKKQCPDVRVLINNASVFKKSDFMTSTMDSFNKHFSVNLVAPIILTREFANNIAKGSIINILDSNITENKTEHFDYLLSKKSLFEFTKQSALKLAPDILVNGIAPGFILLPVNAKAGDINKLIKKIPLEKKGHPKDIVQAVKYLIEQSFITGQIIFCDGGKHLNN